MVINIQEVVDGFRKIGIELVPNTVNVSIPNAADVLRRGVAFFVGEMYKWLPEYEKVAQWLKNNQNRGLLCYGSCGRGKSVICCKVLPVLLSHYHDKIITVVDAQTMNDRLDEVKRNHLLCIDDVGTESVSVNYGNKRMAFSEIVDEAEKKGKLLVITTNLSLSELKDKYGERTFDRLKSITTPVLFKGESLR